jgi:hypothetical protein
MQDAVAGTVATIFNGSQFRVIVPNAGYYGAVKRDTVPADAFEAQHEPME